jgi:CubicO group peptidase (beta-lactamase class C family)
MPHLKNDLPSSASLQELADTLAAGDEPGLAIGIYRDGELAGSATVGCAIPEHGAPVTEGTAFDIASVSKRLTATCLLLLAGDGLIDLDADRGLVPSWPWPGRSGCGSA